MTNKSNSAYRQSILSRWSVRERAEGLVGLLTWLDYDCTREEKERACAGLDPRIQAALDELWEKYYASPKSNGRWSGEPCIINYLS